ncbi:MAG: hypothetical protein DLM50_07690 [Candidatus Meridianibacter frigidus]|nr:MAG: hypothetical protein DLM50_07690 [Candidatus Eremiobacteraeota bacterium]
MEETKERTAQTRENRTVAVLAALFAVLAALATMIAHSRSTTALIEKNEAILAQSRASDAYNYYESKRIKYHLYSALGDAGVGGANTRTKFAGVAKSENAAAQPVLSNARQLEQRAEGYEASSARALSAFETVEIAVTLLEIAIVFVSISALASNQMLLWTAGGLAVAGVVFMVIGVLKHL